MPGIFRMVLSLDTNVKHPWHPIMARTPSLFII